MPVQGAGDFHQLLFRDGQRAHERVGRERGPQPVKRGLATRPHRLPVDAASTRRFGAEVDVLCHRQVGRQCQFLIDDGNAAAVLRQSDR